MPIIINPESNEPIYIQIRNAIVERIATGTFHDGDILPSVHTLSVEAGASLITVNKVYRLQQSEGFIRITRKRGTVIHVECTPESITNYFKSTNTFFAYNCR